MLAGRYGPYVTDGTTNASITKGMNPEALTWEQAQELLAARRDSVPMPRKAPARGRGPVKSKAKPAAASRGTKRKAAGA